MDGKFTFTGIYENVFPGGCKDRDKLVTEPENINDEHIDTIEQSLGGILSGLENIKNREKSFSLAYFLNGVDFFHHLLIYMKRVNFKKSNSNFFANRTLRLFWRKRP